MTTPDQPDPSPQTPRRPKRVSLRPVTIILFLTVNLLVIMILAWPYLQARTNLPFDLPWETSGSLQGSGIPGNGELANSPSPTLVPTGLVETPTVVPTLDGSLPEMRSDPGLWDQGLMVLALNEGLDTHLFAYQPLAEANGTFLPFTRLTGGSWDDITPAINPDRTHLIFASNRDAAWDLYALDLDNGDISQVTHTSGYEASPSWSPDGLWMAYEGFEGNNLDIFIAPVDGGQDPVRLTAAPSADFSPAWSPLGRQIAFVSSRDGRNQVWIANLDESGEDRFKKISRYYEADALHPAWSPDGRYLAWGAVTQEGLHNLYVWDTQNPDTNPKEVGSGDWPIWSPDGRALLAVMRTPAQSYLTAYSLDLPSIVILPPVLLPGTVSGLVWADVEIPVNLDAVELPTPTPLWDVQILTGADTIGGRWDLVPLDDIEAPYPSLHDRVDESFQALRQKLASEAGWDLFNSLENAYIPLSSALSPGMVEDWLYTGRAITFNTLPINAGWMAIVREDFGQQTYWRVYLRARFQDGSQGLPLDQIPWDFNARYSGRPVPYDGGGEVMAAVPDGYWVDLTQLAALYDWERLPALATWRAAYPAARFNQLVKTDGLDWVTAMTEIYPPEVLLTLTPVPTATPSPTPAPLWYRSPTPTVTPFPTYTPTPVGSLTDVPMGTETPTSTVTLSPTGTHTSTPTSTP